MEHDRDAQSSHKTVSVMVHSINDTSSDGRKRHMSGWAAGTSFVHSSVESDERAPSALSSSFASDVDTTRASHSSACLIGSASRPAAIAATVAISHSTGRLTAPVCTSPSRISYRLGASAVSSDICSSNSLNAAIASSVKSQTVGSSSRVDNNSATGGGGGVRALSHSMELQSQGGRRSPHDRTHISSHHVSQPLNHQHQQHHHNHLHHQQSQQQQQQQQKRKLLSDEQRRRRRNRRLQRQALSLDVKPRASSAAQRRRQISLLRQTTIEVPERAYLPGVDMEAGSLARRHGDSRCSGQTLPRSSEEVGARTSTAGGSRRSDVSLLSQSRSPRRRPGSAFSSAGAGLGVTAIGGGSLSLLNLTAAETSEMVTPMLPVLAMAVRQRDKIPVQDKHTTRRMRWAVITTGLILLSASVVMVGVTLKMAPLIDDMVRLENEEIYGEEVYPISYQPSSTYSSFPEQIVTSSPAEAISSKESIAPETASLQDVQEPRRS